MTSSLVPTRALGLQLRASRHLYRRNWPLLPLLIVVLLAIIGPFVSPFDPQTVVGAANLPPGAVHWFGTDATGMDIFSRTVSAARVDISLALAVAVCSTAAGITLGLVIGMNESRRGPVGLAARGLTRLVDLWDAVPALIIGVVVVGLFGASELSLIVALSFILMQSQIRLTRTEVLRVRQEAFVEAARMSGLSEPAIVLRHVLPNAWLPALQNASTIFGVSIMVLAGLGFLGISLPPPTPEWGSMISSGMSGVMLGRWWAAAFPAIVLCAAVISVAAGGRHASTLLDSNSSIR